MPRVLVISFDRLHAGYLGCYGNDWIETEHLDRLAASSVVFDGHFADDLSPEALGRHWWWQPVTDQKPAATSPPVPQRPLPLTAVLRQRGMRSVCFAESDLSTSNRATPLWDELVEIAADDSEGTAEADLPLHQLATAVVEAIQEGQFAENSLLWVRSRGVSEPWYPAAEFAELYYPEFELVDDEPVVERRPPPTDSDDEREPDPWAEFSNEDAAVSQQIADEVEPLASDDPADPELETRVARALYAAYVTSLDRAVGRILHALERAGLLEETLVVVTAASGQLMGEHAVPGQMPEHLPFELTHTPLIVRLPGGRYRGTRRPDFLQPGDLFQGIVDWVAVAGNAASAAGPDGAATGGATGGAAAQVAPSTGALFGAIEQTAPGRTILRSYHPELGWAIRNFRAVYCRRPGEAEGRLFLQPYDRYEFADESAQNGELADQLAAEVPAVKS